MTLVNVETVPVSTKIETGPVWQVDSSSETPAAAYAALGDRVQLPIALAASLAIPVLVATLARGVWPTSDGFRL